jgi:hypothetical protein
MAGFVASLAAAVALFAPQQTGAVAADPEGGPPWAVRFSTRRSADPADELECLQVGRLENERLFRSFSDGTRRELGRDDRTVCGAVPYTMPVILERLVDDPKAAQPRLTRTIVAGMVPEDGDTVTLSVAGQPRTVPVDPGTNTFLVVLPGETERSDLVLRAGSYRLDMTGADDDETGSVYDPGSARRLATLPDPAGGQVGLITYTRTVRTVDGPERQRCLEVGRVIGDEVGAYEPRWGSFGEAPTLASLEQPEDTWAPAGTVAPACESLFGTRRFDFAVTRVSPTHVLFYGFGAVRMPVPATVDPATRSFVALVPSTGARGETLPFSLNGRRQAVHLGPFELPQAMHSVEPRADGRVLRVRWIAGFEPLAAVHVRPGRRRVVLTVSELAPRNFTDAGDRIGIRAIALSKCVDIRLPARLGDRRVVDAVTGAVLRRPPRRASASCARVRANRTFDPPVELPR